MLRIRIRIHLAVLDPDNVLGMRIHHFSKIKSHQEVTKQWESRFFLLFLL